MPNIQFIKQPLFIRFSCSLVHFLTITIMIRFHRRSNRIEIKSNRILLIVLDSYLIFKRVRI